MARFRLDKDYYYPEFGIQRRCQILKKLVCLDEKIVVDIGCGMGDYSIEIAKSCKYAIGIDINVRHVREAKKRARSKHNSNVDFILGCAEALPIKENSAGIVLIIESLEHVENDEKALLESHRILHLKGILFATVPNRFYFYEMHGIKVRNISINLLGMGMPFFSWAPRILRRKFETAKIYSQKDVSFLLRKCCFNVIYMDYIMPTLDVIRGFATMKATTRSLLRAFEHVPILKCMGVSLVVVASSN